MVVDPYHRYSNESERANKDIYDYFKFRFYKEIIADIIITPT